MAGRLPAGVKRPPSRIGKRMVKEPQKYSLLLDSLKPVERGSEKTRRPGGRVKLKVYKLNEKRKIKRRELPNFTNLFKVNTLVECTVP